MNEIITNASVKKNSFSKFIVGFVIAINVLFTIAVLRIFLKTASEPTTLISFWFGFTTAELWQLATIKKKKIDKEKRSGDTYDN